MGTNQSLPGPEAGSPAYLLMARFKRDAAAKRVYTAIQETIRTAVCDLSVYNLLPDTANPLSLSSETSHRLIWMSGCGA